jgi:hypothetical protein
LYLSAAIHGASSSANHFVRRVLAFADFVALDDIGRIHLVFGLRINPAVLDAIARLLVDLMKADLLSLTARRSAGLFLPRASMSSRSSRAARVFSV